MKTRIFICVITICFILFSKTNSQVPNLINFQGYLTDNNNNPLNGSYTINFNIYNSSSGGSSIWSESQSNVIVSEGIYSVLLGGMNPLSSNVFDGGTKYLGIKIGNDSEMIPRREIVSVGYAIKAGTVPDGSITSSKLDEIVEFGKSGTAGKIFVKDNNNNIKVGVSSFGFYQTTIPCGSMQFFGEGNTETVYISSGHQGEEGDLGGISLNNNGVEVAALTARKDNSGDYSGLYLKNGLINTFGPKGNLRVLISYPGGDPDNGAIWIMDSEGKNKISQWVSSSTNAGYISLKNSNGNSVIQLNGDKGEIIGTTKSFRVENPNNPNQEIFYSCIEGPEVGAYLRGTADLKNGEALIELPYHFSLIANDEGITVQITPQSSSSKGIAVIEKSTKRVHVKELFNGDGNYKFDYFVQAVRKGYEDFQVVRNKLAKAATQEDIQGGETRVPLPQK